MLPTLWASLDPKVRTQSSVWLKCVFSHFILFYFLARKKTVLKNMELKELSCVCEFLYPRIVPKKAEFLSGRWLKCVWHGCCVLHCLNFTSKFLLLLQRKSLVWSCVHKFAVTLLCCHSTCYEMLLWIGMTCFFSVGGGGGAKRRKKESNKNKQPFTPSTSKFLVQNEGEIQN